jgi:HEAT repeat protein
MTKAEPSKRRIAFAAAIALFVGTSQLFAADYYTNSPGKERELIETLKSKPPAEKAIACKELAIVGTKKCVPELAKLLGNKELSSWARIALEAIPDPAADEALIKAAGTLHGELLVGTINSIGVRRSAHATELLSRLLKDNDSQVASTAAVALGHIGGDVATNTLRHSLSSAPGPVRSAVAEGCVLCAERLMNEGKSDDAAALYDAVRKSDVPKQRRVEATRGAILARHIAGIPLLLEQLRSPDRAFFYIGLTTARQLPGSEVADALAAELARTTPERAVKLLSALGDRKDPELPHEVFEIAKRGNKQIRIAAIQVLGRRGDTTSVPTLLEIAASPDAELAQSAANALAALPGKDVDAVLVAHLSKTNGKALTALIQAVGERRIEATPQLIKFLNHSDAATRQAALTALGETITSQDLPALISEFVTAKNPEDADIAAAALQTAAVRMPDRDACAAQLAVAMPGASSSARVTLVEILAAMGGPKALEAIGDAAKSHDGALEDAATRALGGWMTVDAAPVLYDLAKLPSSYKYQSRALHGYVRLARQFTMPESERILICENALRAARRNDDRKLVLEVLQRHPSEEALKLAIKSHEFPGLEEDARRASLVIVRKLGDHPSGGVQQPQLREMLAQIGVKPVKVEITKAEYGAGATQRDVTSVLQNEVCEYPIIMLRLPRYRDDFGGDPVPGVRKQLVVHYRIDGQPGEAAFPEDAVIVLPIPKRSE